MHSCSPQRWRRLAHADLIDNSFLAALSNAGIPYSAPASTVALGHSVCPMLVGSQQSFDSVVSNVADNTGMSADDGRQIRADRDRPVLPRDDVAAAATAPSGMKPHWGSMV